MQVILLEKISHLGNIGDIVDVAAGYARNFLFPKKKVMRATQKNKNCLEQQRSMLEQQNYELREKAKQIADSINDKTLKIARQAGEDGKLYGSVNARDIVNAIFTATRFKVSSESILLDKKIKNLGIFDIKIMIHPDVIIMLHISVVRSEN